MLNAVYPILKHPGYCRRYPFYTLNWCQPQEMWKLEISSFVMTSTHLWLAVHTCTSTAPPPSSGNWGIILCIFSTIFVAWTWVQLGGQLLTVTNTRMISILKPLLQSRWLKRSLQGKKTKRQQFYRQKLLLTFQLGMWITSLRSSFCFLLGKRENRDARGRGAKRSKTPCPRASPFSGLAKRKQKGLLHRLVNYQQQFAYMRRVIYGHWFVSLKLDSADEQAACIRRELDGRLKAIVDQRKVMFVFCFVSI